LAPRTFERPVKGMVISSIEEQPLNAGPSISVIVGGITIFLSDLQLRNASFEILITVPSHGISED